MAQIKKIIAPLFVLLCFSVSAAALDPSAVSELAPLGNTTGIKLFCDGVMVVDTARVETENGAKNPAATAGITQGDVIKKIDGRAVKSNEQLKEVIDKCRGNAVSVELLRDGETVKTRMRPEKDTQGEYKVGLWIRDSMAGIGTMTFYDPKSKTFGALGHGICDADTNTPVPLGSGTLMNSKVTEIKKGKAGEPGELVGEYDLSEDSGVLSANTPGGIFGKLTDEPEGEITLLPIGRRDSVRTGEATILSNIRGDEVAEYRIEIIRIFPDSGRDTKNMMLRVTDETLLKKTGGIVQGMSGSPIIQNGKLIGAVTHVLVNDPTRGYGIFIENMLDAVN